MGRVLLIAAALATLVVVGGAVAHWVLHGQVTAESLRKSVERHAGSVWMPKPECRRDGSPGVWSCEVGDSGGSGTVQYRVRVREGSSCWDARMAGPETGEYMPRSVDGCVTLWEWSPLI